MRESLIMALAGLGLGLSLSQPAAAGGWDDGYCCGGTVYVHHHVYYPPHYQHIYHVHSPGPRHVNVVHIPYAYGCCGPVYDDRSWDYHGPRYWYWRGRHW
jgi:hypothetical protein